MLHLLFFMLLSGCRLWPCRPIYTSLNALPRHITFSGESIHDPPAEIACKSELHERKHAIVTLKGFSTSSQVIEHQRLVMPHPGIVRRDSGGLPIDSEGFNEYEAPCAH